MTLARTLLLLLLAHPLLAQGPKPGAVNAAIDRGVAWLLRSQQIDGTWDYGNSPRVGHTALIAYTLIKSGLSPRHHAVQRVMAHLGDEFADKTYDTSLLILALAAHDPDLHQAHIQDLVDQLVDWQKPAGYGYPIGAGDLSNTQYAALGLWAGERAGADVPARTWFDLIKATMGYRLPKGGFGYRQGADKATGSMTAAGVAVLAICRDQLEIENKGKNRRRYQELQGAIDEGLDWLAKNFTVSENPGRGRGHLGYYLYGLERVGALAPTELIGKHAWYPLGASFLVQGQTNQGHWGRVLGRGHEQTCFALLFLRRATMPVTGGLHRRGGRRYASEDPSAEVRIAASGDNPVGMWLTAFGRETLEALTWPEDRSKGLRVARVIWLVDGVEVGRVQGDEGRPAGQERFEHQFQFDQPGAHQLQAEVHVLRPPRKDSSGRPYPASLKVLHSPVLEVRTENACPAWMIQNARDRAQNLLLLAQPRVSASSSRGGNAAANAVDGHQARSWIAARGDRRPSLEIKLGVPQKANVILVGHARGNPIEAGRWARAIEVEVYVNGERHRLRMHTDERKKGRLVLPVPVLVRELRLVVPFAAPGKKGETSVGFAEVELQMRHPLLAKDEDRSRR